MKLKVKVTPITCLCGQRGEAEVQPQSFRKLSARSGWMVGAFPGRFTPAKYPVPTTRWPCGRSERVRKTSLPPGFDSRTVQTVANHCNHRANRAGKHLKFVSVAAIRAEAECKISGTRDMNTNQ